MPVSLGETQAGPYGFGSTDPPSLNCDSLKGKNCALFLLFIHTHVGSLAHWCCRPEVLEA